MELLREAHVFFRYFLYYVPEETKLDSLAYALTETLAPRMQYTGCKLPQPAEETAAFYSLLPQPVGIDQYIQRLVKHLHCSTSVFVVALLYLERLGQRNSLFRINRYNIHRLVLAAITVAAKYLEDNVATNDYYAKVGGITKQEMNFLEIQLLRALDYRLAVEPKQYEETERLLYNLASGAMCSIEDEECV
eukprot:Plantae.Rhodophyta-Purpureofilum_apyrenoidigerum.ctg21090.p1 GENE.Plantae.Rhodophyta-Purpureofilum_apyrenoidigerum.ctg21090~~Plantae.Rhodophyta-Purpureofilum_apyrenoidigerum.ctg21090.p1  ORF type:complete len:191 (+),score=32.24 Plantae.Rhodophyta-Purpureofilum_apyrenoidigerum.ctg21090:358-930(+)